jgi:enoyl-CoA hydratase/carnithine racemase
MVSVQLTADHARHFDPELVSRLQALCAAAQADRSMRVMLLCGGEQYFSAGASEEALLAAEVEVALLAYVREVPRLLLQLPIPTIAVMRGHAIGGGLVLGLWCDFAVLAEESLYGANFMALGLTPGMGATALLEDAFGGPLAREMLFTGRLLKGRELRGRAVPLAHAIVPAADVWTWALALAGDLASATRESLELLKDTLVVRRRAQLELALGLEQQMHTRLFAKRGTKEQIAERYLPDGFFGRGTAE